MKIKKTQGEIFGMALVFVLLFLGIMIYARFSALTEKKSDSQSNVKYEILAEKSLDSILLMSTGCQVEHGKDSLKNLISYCLNSGYSATDNPVISCDDGSHQSCSYAKEIINKTLWQMFNSSSGIGHFPFEFRMNTTSVTTLLSNIYFTNFGYVKYRDSTIDTTNRRSFDFVTASSGPASLPTSRRAVQFELNVYHQ